MCPGSVRSSTYGEALFQLLLDALVRVLDIQGEIPRPAPKEERPLVLLLGTLSALWVVVGEIGDDGFFEAEISGKAGLIPSNFVEEILPEDPRYEEIMGGGVAAGDGFAAGSIVVALHTYSPELSPNDDDGEELAFVEGDKMRITGDMDEDGFYSAEHLMTGKAGLIPSNFVDLVERGFYNGMKIQRSDGFVVQTGDPNPGNDDKGTIHGFKPEASAQPAPTPHRPRADPDPTPRRPRADFFFCRAPIVSAGYLSKSLSTMTRSRCTAPHLTTTAAVVSLPRRRLTPMGP